MSAKPTEVAGIADAFDGRETPPLLRGTSPTSQGGSIHAAERNAIGGAS